MANVSRTFTTDTNGSYSPGEVCDNAGNCITCPMAQVRIDKTAPTCGVTGGSSSWFNTNRTITGTCSDSGSGCSSNVTRTFTSNTNGSFSPGSVCDNAGNCTTCGTAQVRVDKSAPTCANSGGSTVWTNGNRTITGTCSDTGGSGCTSSTVTRTYSTNINTTTASPGSVCDNAGNCTTCPTDRTVRIDKSAPTCVSSGGSTVWTNGNRTITGTCSDNGGSGCTSSTVTRTYSTNTNTTSASPGDVCDNAGNCTTCPANRTVRIDKSAPTCSVSGSSSAWYNTDRTITGTCSDTGGSGCVSSTVTRTYTTNINTTTASPGDVCDSAGNCTTCTNATVRIDKTAPGITRNPSGQAEWGNSNIVVTLTGTDSGGSGYSRMRTRQSINDGATYGSWSSFTTTNPITRTLSTTGNHRIQIEAEDNAGNKTIITTSRYRIDKDIPTAPSTGGTTTTWYNVDRTFNISGGNAGPSGRARYEYRRRTVGSSWGAWTTYSSPITHTTNTNREYQARVIDNAGNIGTSSAIGYIRVDKTKPYHNPNLSSIWVRHWNSSTGVEWSPTITNPSCNTAKTLCTASILICKRTGGLMVYGYTVNVEDALSGVAISTASLDRDRWLDKNGNELSTIGCSHVRNENPCRWERFHRSLNDRAGNPSGEFLLRLTVDYASSTTHSVCNTK